MSHWLLILICLSSYSDVRNPFCLRVLEVLLMYSNFSGNSPVVKIVVEVYELVLNLECLLCVLN